MKKRLTLLICALLTAILVFSTSCANTDLSKFFPHFEIRDNLATLSLTKDDYVEGCDAFGLMVVATPSFDEEGSLVSTKYRLYNSRTDAFIEGAESNVLVDSDPEDGALSTTVSVGIHPITDGMYALATFIGTRESAEDEFDTTVKVELFGKNGKAGEAEFDQSVMYNSPYDDQTKVFTDWSGVRYYVNVKGNLVKENDVFARILSYNNVNYNEVIMLDNYYAVMLGDGTEFYDLDGKFIRSENLSLKIGITENFTYKQPKRWTIGDYIFVQYSLLLPEDSKNYDYLTFDETFLKWDLVTKRYSVKDGKIKDMDMDVIVTEAYGTGTSGLDGEILYYCEIIDKQVSINELVQCFDKDLNVLLDIQKLVPGAYDVELRTDSMLILSHTGISVLKGKEIVKVFPRYVDVYGNSIIVRNTPTTLDIYDINGQLKKQYKDILGYNIGTNMFNETLYLTLEDSIVEYDLFTHSEKVLASFNNETVILKDFKDLYIETESAGEDGDFDTDEDNIINIKFLIDGIADVQLQYNDDFDCKEIGFYYDYNAGNPCVGSVIRVEITDGETGEITATYYRNETVVVYEDEGK